MGLLKIVPVCFLDRKFPCVICMNLLKLNGLNCDEHNMLMHGIQCVNMMFELYKNIIVSEPLELNCLLAHVS